MTSAAKDRICSSSTPPASAPRCSPRWPAHLAGSFHCWGLDLRAHGRSDRPPDGNFAWSGFATDVLAVIDHFGLVAPSGFGHSCGGAALLLGEQSRAGTFGSLYCFEPVGLPVAAGREPPWFEDNPLTVGARRRRDSFPSAEDAFVNFSSKPPFSDLDPEVLRWLRRGGLRTGAGQPRAATASPSGSAAAARTRP